MKHEIHLLEYLPDYLKQVKELNAICDTEEKELETIEEQLVQLMDDCFLSSCGITGIKRYESMLETEPLPGDSLEDRRFRLLAKWNNTVPYNFAYLQRQLALLCGADGYRMQLDQKKGTLTVKVVLVSKNMLESVRQMLENVIPCSICLDVDLLYNQYGTVKKYTCGQLKQYTYRQIREEVMPG